MEELHIEWVACPCCLGEEQIPPCLECGGSGLIAETAYWECVTKGEAELEAE